MFVVLAAIIITLLVSMFLIKRSTKMYNLTVTRHDIVLTLIAIVYINMSGFIIFGKNWSLKNALSFSRIFCFVIFNSFFIWVYPKIVISYLQCKKSIKEISSAIFVFFLPTYAFFLVEFPYNNQMIFMEWIYRLINIAFSAIFLIIMFNLTIRKRVIIIWYLFFHLFFGMANGFVILFKDAPIMPSDFLALNTAVEVAGQYNFSLTMNMIYSIIIFGILVCGCVYFVPHRNTINSRRKKFLGIVLTLFAGIIYIYIDFAWIFQISFNDWKPAETYYQYGFILSMGTYAQKVKAKKPDGYSESEIQEILESVCTEKNEIESYPTIIAIMNESYSDLKVFEDFDCEPEYMPFWKENDSFLMSGNLYVSTYGGGTANTEFEFLTGNSVMNLGIGSYPYQIYNFSHMPNLARTLKSYGYKTVALHPENPNNWNRESVYKEMGFDYFFNEKDFENPILVRNYVSDESSYDKIIEVFEKTNSPTFIFNITMQNHGGYLTDYYSDEQMVQLSDELQQYTDLREYLTLINESDKALKDLISYFEQQERPVLICFFGDHQPGLAHIFEKEGENELEKKYITPYFIWSNYKKINENKDNLKKDISVNYLGAILLKEANLVSEKRLQFLIDMCQEIPIYNIGGYRNANGIWNGNFDDEKEWIRKYKMIQYYYMFAYKDGEK